MNMSDMTKKLYPVTGMHCAACAGNVEKIVRKQEGVENASVNLAAATLAVTYNPDIVSPDHRTVDGEILQFGPDVDQVHIGEIHPVRRIAVLQPCLLYTSVARQTGLAAHSNLFQRKDIGNRSGLHQTLAG